MDYRRFNFVRCSAPWGLVLSSLLASTACALPGSEPVDPEIESASTGSGDDGPTPASTTGMPSRDDSPADGSSGDSGLVPECTPETVEDDCFMYDAECNDLQCIDGECIADPDPDGSVCDYEFESGTCWGGNCHYECIEDEQCDEPCYVGTCTQSLCSAEQLDGVPAQPEYQEPGDCEILMCEGGSYEGVDDPEDAQDDGDACTIDRCVEGETVHELAPEGTPCDDVGATCDAAGACVAPG